LTNDFERDKPLKGICLRKRIDNENEKIMIRNDIERDQIMKMIRY